MRRMQDELFEYQSLYQAPNWIAGSILLGPRFVPNVPNPIRKEARSWNIDFVLLSVLPSAALGTRGMCNTLVVIGSKQKTTTPA